MRPGEPIRSNAESAPAAWRHRGARDGFELLFIRGTEHAYRCEGEFAAVEDGSVWAVRSASRDR